MKTQKHLPLIGVGPLIVIVPLLLTLVSLILSKMHIIYKISIGNMHYIFMICGIILLVYAIYMWLKANFIDNIRQGIKHNHLITTGIYARSRNPIYSSFLLLCTALIFLEDNIILFIIPIICWGYMTLLIKYTEEKWLLNMYKQDYRYYMKNVYRLFPIKKYHL